MKQKNIIQIIILLFVIGTLGFIAYSTQQKIAAQNISSGFGFLQEESGFEISESLIEYSSFDTYKKALTAGVLNTLKVSVLGNFLALILGILVGISLLSSNILVEKICRSYVEVMRNTPLLLQLFFWYTLMSSLLPAPQEAFSFAGAFFSNRGVAIPWFEWSSFSWSYPQLKAFNFEGGRTLSIEFSALLFGLVTYTAAFIAEIIRAGLLSVSKGQWEAGSTLGLSSWQTIKLIIFPQALRVAIPPLTSQILNLTKNSSLAVAIAYPDFVSVANTIMNQTGQALEVILLILLVYLTFSLLTAVFMNWYNKKIALVER
ncbi:MAG: ABC transporter permease subunit [Bdellovibrionaceae bacterium]|nr:ABC transporter permease subunit [Pseudobdellovibrionaceae bacterium]